MALLYILCSQQTASDALLCHVSAAVGLSAPAASVRVDLTLAADGGHLAHECPVTGGVPSVAPLFDSATGSTFALHGTQTAADMAVSIVVQGPDKEPLAALAFDGATALRGLRF